MKITKYILSLAAAIGMIAGCQKAEMVQMLPADQAVAPVLADLPDSIKITPLNMAVDSVVFNWTRADFGVSTQVTYAIEVAEAGGSTKAIVSSGITDTTAVLYYETINVALFEGLELLDGVATPVEFYVSAYTGESAKIYSAGVPVNATATAAERQYPFIYLLGSYNEWTHGTALHLFDFAGTDKVYQAVIDFGEEHAANEFKITPEANWDAEWGLDGEAGAEAEAASTVLLTSGGGNINIYTAKRYYHFALDKSSNTLTKNMAFDQVGVIGVNGDWDNDVVMEFHAAKQRFYADVEFTADGNFKFRADAGWDLNWGVKDGVVTAGGDNIEAKAGKYRVYLNLNNPDNITYELNAKAYGIEEGTPAPEEPETPETPVEVKGWNLIGVGGNWDNDVLMSDISGFRAALNVALKAGEGFKLRLDGKWDDNRGLLVGADVTEENVTIAIGEALDVVKDGKNMTVPTDGNYDIYYDNANEKLYVLTAGSNVPGSELALSQWGIVGDKVNGWGTSPDIPMFVYVENLFVAYEVNMPAGPFKIRGNNEWNDAMNCGLVTEGEVAVDHAYEAVNGSGAKNATIAEGTYDIWLDMRDAAKPMIYIMTPGKDISEAEGGVAEAPDMSGKTWYLVGSFNEWNPADPAYTMTAEGDYFVFKNWVVEADCEVKFAPGEWNGDKGGVFAVDAACPTGSDNIKVPAGTYDVYLSKDVTTFYFMTEGKTPADAGAAPETPEQPAEPEDFSDEAWYLVGTINNWDTNDTTYPLVKGEKWLVYEGVTLTANDQVKLHTDDAWTVNRGAVGDVDPYVMTAGVAVEAVNYGKNLSAPAGTYDIYMNFAADKIFFMAPGEVPAE